ncbi:pentapeptide repeat-containing protein [Amycolatopsis orientalis]|uniref:pentapeptide repeat-containing protein n=1 Tax=Amycolatopsis orientalis TaxID=31958 RepID=UPI001F331654|nr:pentapeptide repeat-containing protein [Amycolatopsis orientalis]
MKVSGFEQCLAHLHRDQLQEFLSTLGPGADLDARGTTFNEDLLAQIAQVFAAPSPDAPAGGIRFGSLDCARAHFVEKVWLPDVTFTGSVNFASARFDKDVRIVNAQFDGQVSFCNATFDGLTDIQFAYFSRLPDFDDTRFNGEARFDHTNFVSGATFQHARFGGDTTFTGARTEDGDIDFEDVWFGGNSTFRDVRFLGGAIFSDVWFSGLALFEGSQFEKYTGFIGARFDHAAEFRNAQFGSGVRFDHAKFNGYLDFAQVHVARKATFTGGRFEVASKLGPLSAGELVLDDVILSRSAVVEVDADWVSCDGARFEDGVALRLRHAVVSLQRVFFGGPSSLQGQVHSFPQVNRPTIPQAENAPTSQKGGTIYREAPRSGVGFQLVGQWEPSLVSLQATDVSELILTDVDLRWCRFAGAHHLDKLRIEGQSHFHRPPSGWQTGWAWPSVWRWTRRDVLAEEHDWRCKKPGAKAKTVGWQPHPLSDDDSHLDIGSQRLAAVYRSLRKALEDGKDEAGAGDFYYGEMEARRHGGPFRDRVVLTAYWLVSGYGQRAFRAVTALAVLVATITILLMSFGLPAVNSSQQITGVLPQGAAASPQTVTLQVNESPLALPAIGQRWTWDRAGKAVQTAIGSVVFRDAGQKLTSTGTWTVMMGRFLGPLLIALALLAIRARVKR